MEVPESEVDGIVGHLVDQPGEYEANIHRKSYPISVSVAEFWPANDNHNHLSLALGE